MFNLAPDSPANYLERAINFFNQHLQLTLTIKELTTKRFHSFFHSSKMFLIKLFPFEISVELVFELIGDEVSEVIKLFKKTC